MRRNPAVIQRRQAEKVARREAEGVGRLLSFAEVADQARLAGEVVDGVWRAYGRLDITSLSAFLLSSRTPAALLDWVAPQAPAGHSAYTLHAARGVYALAGQPATLTYQPSGGYRLVAGTGSYVFTGRPATLSGPDPLQDNLVASWLLNESSGSRADSSGNSLTLTQNGGVGYSIGRFSRCARLLASSSQYLNIADPSQLDFTTAFTISCWVYLQSLGGNGSLWGKFASDASSGIGVSQSGASSDELTLYIGGGGATAETSGLALKKRHLYNITVVYDGGGATDADKLKLYVDGVNKSLTPSGTFPTTLTNNSADFRIGSLSSGFPRYLDGWVSDVCAWNVAQTAGEVARIYNSGLGRRITAAATTQGTKTGTIVFEGDSMTEPNSTYQTFPGYPGATMELVNVGGLWYDWANYGQSSDEISHAQSQYSTEAGTYAGASPKIAVIWIGRNSIYDDGGGHPGISGEAAAAAFITLCETYQADGYQVIAVSPPPGVDMAESRWNAFNAALVTEDGGGSPPWAELILFYNIPAFNAGFSAYLNTTYFHTDQRHITDAGAAALAAAVADAIEAL